MIDFISKGRSYTILYKVDLKKWYYQIPMNPEDVPKMAISAH